jgi:hypothetical protein
LFVIFVVGASSGDIISTMNISQPEYPSNRARKFLETYAKTGSMTGAAKAAKISLASHSRRLETDPAYRKAFEGAQEQVVDLLEAEAFRRALAGSDELLIFLLRAWEPDRYREHVVHEHSGTTTLSAIATSTARGVVRRLIPIDREQVQ